MPAKAPNPPPTGARPPPPPAPPRKRDAGLAEVRWLLIGSTAEYADLKRDLAHVCRDVTRAACIDEICIHDILATLDRHGYKVVPKDQ